ncbi:MAG TPA: fimbria/pilus periplasmic chaperone [Lysobacter sp.]|nr:fimbria/pilus periplasmic chaperone [Lysobacter sp.]
MVRAASLRAFVARSLLVLVLLPCTVAAGGFQITPTIAEVPPGTKVASFHLRNTGAGTTAVQIDLLAWRQSEAGEQLTPSNDAVVVPRLAKLAPGASQLVRVALPQSRSSEQAYRLRLREVPSPPPPGFMGVQTLVEQLVPVFFQVSGESDVRWQAQAVPGGELLLRAANTGGRHLRAVDLALLDADGRVLAQRKGPAYALAGATMAWRLSPHGAAPARGSPVRLRYIRNGTVQDVAVTLD